MKAIAFILLAFFTITIINGCGNSSDLDANGVPHKLLIGSYGGDNPAQTKGALEPFRAYLQKKLGMEIQFFYTTDYTAVIEAMRSKKIQMAHLTPFAYVLAKQKPGLTPIATLGINGQPTLYHSIIFTNHKTGLKSMDDVKARAKSLTLCFADPASTSGHLIPRAYLKSIGLDPKTAFKETMFAGSHMASVMAVKGGKVDVGCSFEYNYEKMIRQKMINPEDLIILWKSDPIVEGPIVMRPDINTQFTERVREAY